MIDAVNNGSLSIEKLEAMTAICSVGLDMIAIPGSTPASSIAAMIADEAAIGVINHKTTAVRIIPAKGKEIGEMVEFGGLLGERLLWLSMLPLLRTLLPVVDVFPHLFIHLKTKHVIKRILLKTLHRKSAAFFVSIFYSRHENVLC